MVGRGSDQIVPVHGALRGRLQFAVASPPTAKGGPLVSPPAFTVGAYGIGEGGLGPSVSEPGPANTASNFGEAGRDRFRLSRTEAERLGHRHFPRKGRGEDHSTLMTPFTEGKVRPCGHCGKKIRCLGKFRGSAGKFCR